MAVLPNRAEVDERGPADPDLVTLSNNIPDRRMGTLVGGVDWHPGVCWALLCCPLNVDATSILWRCLGP